MKRLRNILGIALISVIFPAPNTAGELTMTETADTIRVTLRGKPVLEYIKTEKPVPDGLPAGYRRSGYIHPIYNPTGQEVTGDFPVDHAHQHGLFFAWAKATFDGEEVDFWNQLLNKGRIEHRGLLARSSSEDRVSFSARHAFVTGPEDKRTDALYETWTVTIHRTPDDYYLFDIESIQECASDKPFTNEEYHYGGMALRGNYEWYKEVDDRSIDTGDLIFITSDGKNRWEGNHTRPNWVAMTGLLNGQETSITVMGSPTNFRAPQPIRIHPNKPYFCFAPMVEGAFTIKPGMKYVSRYRYLVTSRAHDQGLVEKLWREYALSPE